MSKLCRALLCAVLLCAAAPAAAAAAGFPATDCPQYGELRICSAEVPSFDGTPLDADLTLPAGEPPRGGGHRGTVPTRSGECPPQSL